MPDNAETLARLRDQIDQTDRDMHELLIRRSQVIEQLIAAKGTRDETKPGDGTAFRPDREATVMTRLAERHQGVLPFLAVAHIWRVIIATFTQAQAPYTVHLGGDAHDLRDLARFQFGFSTPFAVAADAKAAIAQVSANQGDLALVRLTGDDCWWRNVADVHVMAVLPNVALPRGLAFPRATVVSATSVPVDMLSRAVLSVLATDSDMLQELATRWQAEFLAGPVMSETGADALISVERFVAAAAIEDGSADVRPFGGTWEGLL